MNPGELLDLCNDIYIQLGHGHSESVYHRALEVGLRLQNISYESEKIVPVSYEGHVVGYCKLDLVIDNSEIIELKSISSIKSKEITQLNNYMNLTGIKRGTVINFSMNGGKEVENFSISL